MISKINRLKKLGLVFQDFTWNQSLPAFKKVNLIYAWNGCGKTTLTRLFEMIKSGQCESTEFDVEDDTGNVLTTGQTASFPIKIFNEDYVERNISVANTSANSISILLGDQNKELAAKVKADLEALNGSGGNSGLVAKETKLAQDISSKQKLLGKIFTDVARTISAASAGSASASRTYRAPNARSDFEGLEQESTLSDEELSQALAQLKQDVLEPVSVAAHPIVDLGTDTGRCLEVLEASIDRSTKLCRETVQARAIERLTANPDIAAWVAQGFDLHDKHKRNECEYCGNKITPERLEDLAGHFNDADKELKEKLDAEISRLRSVYSAVNNWRGPEPAALYPELRETAKVCKTKFDDAKVQLLAQIEKLAEELKSKKLQTTVSIDVAQLVETSDLRNAAEAAQQITAEHNNKTSAFQDIQSSNLSRIKTHYLSAITSDVRGLTDEITKLDSDLRVVSQEKREAEARLASNRAAISSSHKACELINRGLKSFLGRSELSFVPQSSVSVDTQETRELGYAILRNGKPARSLSEGEKTAIALVYFAVHLHDGQNEISETLVVIDDPISSLDSNSLYQAFSFLKNSVKDCHQVFFLTHNFEFLRLLMNWRSRVKKKTGYYMISNRIHDGKRAAEIIELDQTLREFETEYLYLFKTLRQLLDNNELSIATAYPIPNMARKLWESFVMFRVPVGANTYSRVEVLKEEGLDAQRLDAIYKFTNDQSHITGAGLDPSLVPEADKVLRSIFDIMEEAAPKHYELLEQSLAE